MSLLFFCNGFLSRRARQSSTSNIIIHSIYCSYIENWFLRRKTRNAHFLNVPHIKHPVSISSTEKTCFICFYVMCNSHITSKQNPFEMQNVF